MNQIKTLPLRSFLRTSEAWGNDLGREVCSDLLRFVESNPGYAVFEVSLAGIRRTDASFPRESVAEIARRFKKQIGFFLSNISDPDLLDNWDAAALKKEQPLFVKFDEKSWKLLGPQVSAPKMQILEYVIQRHQARANQVAADLNLKINNASTQLKGLWESGYLLRREEVSGTGGLEFIYFSIV